MIRKLIFGDGKGSRVASDYQDEAHTMCREGLVSFSPVLTSPRKVRGELDRDMLEALHSIEKGLESGQWLPSMELYPNGFNIWIGYNSHPEAVGLVTYRREEGVFAEGEEVQVNIKQWLGQEAKGKPKWKDVTITKVHDNGTYTTTDGIYNGNAIRRKS